MDLTMDFYSLARDRFVRKGRRMPLRAAIESIVLREGTYYGVHETSLEDKFAQVLIQLRHGEAHMTSL